MKIAYLILAHHQPKQLYRLVSTLNAENVSFFIYVDLKADISKFNCFDYADNVTFLQKRVSVNRFGYSQPLAMTELMRAAYSSDDFDYYMFLSGNDYPIKDNYYINDFLENNYPTNFINFYPLVEGADYINNIKQHKFVDQLKDSPKHINIIIRLIQFVINKIIGERSFIEGMIPYRGSTSWCLNSQTLSYILEFLNSTKAKQFTRHFKSIWGADEIFFQTIVLNSPLAKHCRHYDRDIKHAITYLKNENKAYLHHIDWSADREDPAILDMRDYELLKNSEMLFARKFFEDKSNELLDKIDEELISVVV